MDFLKLTDEETEEQKNRRKEELISKVYKEIYHEIPEETKKRIKLQRHWSRDQHILNERLVHCEDLIKVAKQKQEVPVFVVSEDTPSEIAFRYRLLASVCALWFLDFCFFLHYEAEVLDEQGRFHDKDILWFLFLYKKLASGAWAPYCTSAKRIRVYLEYKGYKLVWPRAK